MNGKGLMQKESLGLTESYVDTKKLTMGYTISREFGGYKTTTKK